MRRALLASVTGTALMGVMVPAMADSLTPATCPGACTGFSGSISVGTTTSITNKVGVITAGTPTTAMADVLFVTDTTGSMGPAIGAIESAFSATVTNLAGLGNIAFGAAQYKDLTSDGSDPFDYHLDQAISTNATLTKTAISGYSAGGGGDDPEQGLNALTQASSSTTGWRAGSKKIVVIVGDAPSHSSPGHPPAANGVSVSSTAAALVTAGVTVEALNASNITGDSGLNSFGQFSGAGSLLADGVAGSFTGTSHPPAHLPQRSRHLSAAPSPATAMSHLICFPRQVPAPLACRRISPAASRAQRPTRSTSVAYRLPAPRPEPARSASGWKLTGRFWRLKSDTVTVTGTKLLYLSRAASYC